MDSNSRNYRNHHNSDIAKAGFCHNSNRPSSNRTTRRTDHSCACQNSPDFGITSGYIQTIFFILLQEIRSFRVRYTLRTFDHIQ
jgi:hypothetical protein